MSESEDQKKESMFSNIWHFLNSNIIVFLISTLLTPYMSKFVRLIFYNQDINYSRVNYIYILIIFVVVVIILLTNLLIKKSAYFESKVYNVKVIAVLLASVLICSFIILPLLFPSFEITEPKKGSFVNDQIIVSGHGAIPGSSVKLYVVSNGAPHPQQAVHITPDGLWQCDCVYIGQPGGDKGKEFTIYATLTKDGTDYATPSISVIKS